MLQCRQSSASKEENGRAHKSEQTDCAKDGSKRADHVPDAWQAIERERKPQDHQTSNTLRDECCEKGIFAQIDADDEIQQPRGHRGDRS